MRSILLSSALAAFLWADTVGGIAILVKNSPITLHDLQVEMKESGATAEQSSDALIRKKLEQLEAKERKIVVSTAEVNDELERMAKQNNLSLEKFLQTMQNVRGLNETALRHRVEESIIGQKLYSAIAFSKMAQPTPEEESEYYQLHINDFSRPESFSVTTYVSSSQDALVRKITSPMENIAVVKSKDETIPFEKINPQLAQFLNKISVGKFSTILPNGDNGFMAFYMKEKNHVVTEGLEKVRPEISNAIMNERRNQVLNDYFSRLRLNADIKTLRMP